ncbi:Fc receptor-like protein 5 isoform X2 [Melanotaenia boesemani]|uniref:Fc receptor-like protein 5 isoform X2 n=1 Tax=Melanotaenia boesemani TaxID=1250792 RepID=UPI001C05574A|nr:Fc receptor-like protein 5 isoform X2 [Melanotaenia boesemani]
MGLILFCVLDLFWLYTLLCTGHTQGAVLTIDPNWSTFYTGESVTFICDMKEGTNTDWEYKILKDGQEFFHYNSHSLYRLRPLHISDEGEYQCCGRLKTSRYSKCSNKIFLNVQADKPRAEVTAGTTTISVGGSVTLSCSVDNSAGWKYQWFRRTSHTSEYPLKTNDEQNRIISVSQGGIYRCRGERGDPAFYSDMSNDASINIIFSNQVVVTRQPDWPQIFSGEKITLTCEIQGGETTEWMCVWRHLGAVTPWKSSKQFTFTVSERSSGDYQCQCKRRDDSYSSTKWSEAIRLSASEKPRPVLSVSPSWLSPGSSVTLRCEIKPPSAGWRFYWYKAVPDLSHRYGPYSYDLLPGSSNGTAGSSTIVHEQTHTAGYVCRAEKVDRVYSTDHSQRTFVWSEDIHPAASLTVNPDRVQHFSSDPVSLNCEGNSSEWRVMSLVNNVLSQCSFWGTMNGQTCTFKTWFSDAVYWCESGSALSNAVNITGQFDSGGVILLSPVQPVTEGESVTLGCTSRIKNILSNVLFYKNGQLMQNDTRGEMIMTGVSKSDEGLYKCLHSGNESPQSWMAVKPASRTEKTSFVTSLVVGLLCGILLIFLLLLLCLYKLSKGSFFTSTNQSSATDKDEAQLNKNTSLHGNASVYESVNGPDDAGNDAVYAMADEFSDVTYSAVELKTITKKRENKKAEEKSVYSAVKIGSSTDKNHYNNAAFFEGKSAPAANEAVCSEVTPENKLDEAGME